MLKQEIPVDAPEMKAEERRSGVIGLASLGFILLQSAGTAFMAFSGLRLLAGLGSLAAAGTGLRILDSVHGVAVRLPMEALAVGGSAMNLYAIWRVRSLRSRASSQWRMGSVTAEKKRSESVQIALAVLTLLLVAVEWASHVYLHGSI